MFERPNSTTVVQLPEYLLKVCKNYIITQKLIESPNVFFEVADKQGEIKAVIVNFGKKFYFLDVRPGLKKEDISSLLQELYNSELSAANGFLFSNGKRITQIGSVLAEDEYASHGTFKITKELVPNVGLEKMKDEGTAEKTNWRFSMIDFAKKVFPKGPPKDSVVGFFPGASSHEMYLWNSFGFKLDDMILIEGDINKAPQIRLSFTNGKSPKFVTSWLGNNNGFVDKLFKEIGERVVGILSFDTESSFSLLLYDELVHIFENIEIKNDFFFSLNLVARVSDEVCMNFLVQAEQRHNTKYRTGDLARKDLMKFLPIILLKDSERTDLEFVTSSNGQYSGTNAVTMEYVFSHFRKK
jgi:hypothetical protein